MREPGQRPHAAAPRWGSGWTLRQGSVVQAVEGRHGRDNSVSGPHPQAAVAVFLGDRWIGR